MERFIRSSTEDGKSKVSSGYVFRPLGTGSQSRPYLLLFSQPKKVHIATNSTKKIGTMNLIKPLPLFPASSAHPLLVSQKPERGPHINTSPDAKAAPPSPAGGTFTHLSAAPSDTSETWPGRADLLGERETETPRLARTSARAIMLVGIILTVLNAMTSVVTRITVNLASISVIAELRGSK